MAIIAFGEDVGGVSGWWNGKLAPWMRYTIIGAGVLAAVGITYKLTQKKPAALTANKRKAAANERRHKRQECHECGEEFKISPSGTSHHVDRHGGIDHDADADHVPYSLEPNKRRKHKRHMRANVIGHKYTAGCQCHTCSYTRSKRRKTWKCPVCAMRCSRGQTHCTRCGKASTLRNNGRKRHVRRNPPYGVYEVAERRVGGDRDIAAAVRMARGLAHSRQHDKVVVYDEGRKNRGPHGEFIAMFRPNAKAKRAPGWQKKLYKGPATKWRTHAPPKYAKYGATQASHYAFPEAFKYPIHGHDVATTKRFIRTAASRYAKFKGRIAPEFREAVGRRIEAAKKKYGIGVYSPKYARKAPAKRRKVA